MSAALDNGLAVTALHNHFFFDEPKVYFMHIGGEGAVDGLARGVRATFDQVKRVRAAHPDPATASDRVPVPTENQIPADELDAILETKGQAKDGMYKAVFGRRVSMPCGCDVGKGMGVNTWAAFAGNAEHALVDGDFVTVEAELQPVLKSFRRAGIDIVAIHSHMEGESPKALFLHYWGVGRAADLARAVKAALDAQNHETPEPIGSVVQAEVDFDETPSGGLPKNWFAGVTGKGTAMWTVTADATAPSMPSVLAQTGQGTFPICVDTGVSLADGFVQVKFKPISGSEDRAGGLIWRFKDKDNYYVARANALEDNVTIYHTVNGSRRPFKSVDMKVSDNAWHTLRVEFRAAHFTVYLDGQKALEADDEAFREPGAVGVWTKADSVTHFDDFSYGPPAK